MNCEKCACDLDYTDREQTVLLLGAICAKICRNNFHREIIENKTFLELRDLESKLRAVELCKPDASFVGSVGDMIIKAKELQSALIPVSVAWLEKKIEPANHIILLEEKLEHMRRQLKFEEQKKLEAGKAG